MNKEEAKQKLHNLAFAKLNTIPDDLKFADVMRIVNQIDEPLKREVVPQFVADWYEDNKNMLDTNLFGCIYEIYKKRNQNYLKKFEEWLFDSHTTPFQTLANMHQFGYEVEKEKRYAVKLKNTNDYLNQTEVGFHFYDNGRNNEKFTRKEIEDAGFGEVFNSPLFEVEEVE